MEGESGLNYYIQARQSFLLQDVWSLFQQMNGIEQHTAQYQAVYDKDGAWEELYDWGVSHDFVQQEWWEKEKQAYRAMLQMIQPSDHIYLAPLQVPTQFPVEWSRLLEGLVVDVCAEQFVLSPLLLFWLKKVNVSCISPFPARVDGVCTGKGVVLMRLTAQAQAPSPSQEQHQHEDEHIDESMVLVQANIDDSTPEWLGYVMDKLFKAGANDVNLLPLTMKKGRQASMLQVLCYQSSLDRVKQLLFTETTTFGLRYFPVACHRLARRFHTVTTPWGKISVKLGYLSGERVQIAPEYDECAQMASQEGVPLKKVYQTAVQIATEETPEKL